jgi:glc operon protein GlcG
MIQRYQLTHRDAQAILSAIQAELERGSLGAAVAVVDSQGELLAFLRTDGCRLPSITIAINKAYTAAREQRPSKAIGQSSREDGWPMTNFGESRYTGWGGGVPIIFQEQVVGAVGVSGLPEDVDMELAQLGAGVPLQVVLPPPAVD